MPQQSTGTNNISGYSSSCPGSNRTNCGWFPMSLRLGHESQRLVQSITRAAWPNDDQAVHPSSGQPFLVGTRVWVFFPLPWNLLRHHKSGTSASLPDLFVFDQWVQELLEDWDTHEQMDGLENKLKIQCIAYWVGWGGFLLFGLFFFFIYLSPSRQLVKYLFADKQCLH